MVSFKPLSNSIQQALLSPFHRGENCESKRVTYPRSHSQQVPEPKFELKPIQSSFLNAIVSCTAGLD